MNKMIIKYLVDNLYINNIRSPYSRSVPFIKKKINKTSGIKSKSRKECEMVRNVCENSEQIPLRSKLSLISVVCESL